MMSRMRLHAKAKKDQDRKAAGIEEDEEETAKPAEVIPEP